MVMVRRRRRKIIIIVCAISIVLAASAVGYWLLFGRSASPLPKELVAQATFPIYYPEKLPEGYTLKPGSATGDSTAVYYTLIDATGKQSITVTTQATPNGFDASKLIGASPIPTTITPNGTLYNLSAGGSTKYMLTTGEAMVFITSPGIVNASVVSSITNSFTRHD